MENVHSETYSLLIDTLIKDPKERYGLLPYSYIIMIYYTVWFNIGGKSSVFGTPAITLLLAVYRNVADHALT